MQIFEDVLTKSEIEAISSHLLSDDFPWYFTPNVTHRKNNYFDPALYHHFIEGTEFADLICKRTGFAPPSHARSCLQLPNGSAPDAAEGLHVDCYHDTYEPHIVLVYYVVDSDGPTVLTNRTYDETPTLPTEYTISHLIEPVAGRVLAFDGAIWHTSIKPKKHVRCIINIHVPKYAVFDASS
jgi:hypothetical protein